MKRSLFTLPQWTEPVAFVLLSLTLILRYPVHFALQPPFLMDFEVYRAIAQRLLQGEGAHLYQSTNSAMMVFKYAPVWALIWTPLGRLTAHAAAVTWTLLSVLALLAALLMCSRLCRLMGIRYHPITAVPAVLIIVRPLAEEMGNGQVNLLWGCLVVGFVLAAATNRPWRAAVALAGAILLKLPALVFLPYLALSRQWRLLGHTLLMIGLALLGSCALIAPRDPLSLLGAWAHALMDNGTAYAFMIGNQSVLALLARAFTADGYGLNVLALPREALPWIALGLLACAMAVVALPARHRAPSSGRFLYDSAMLTVLMVIFSPSGFSATYTALLFPVFLGLAAVAHLLGERRPDALALALACLAVALSLFTNRRMWSLFHLTSWRGEGYLYIVFMVLPLLGLALLGLLWRARTRICDSSPTGTSRPSRR